MPFRPKPINHRLYWSLFFVCMTVLALFVRWHVVQLDREVRREGLSSQIYITTRSVLINTLDVETGIRGYLIAGRPDYLRPYYEGLGRLGADMATLRSLTASDTREAPHVAATDQAVTHVLAEFANQVVVGQEEDVESARQRFLAYPTKPTMDLIRDHLLAVQVEETRKIAEASETLVGQMVATLWLLNTFTFVSVLLLAAMIAGMVATPTERGPVAQ